MPVSLGLSISPSSGAKLEQHSKTSLHQLEVVLAALGEENELPGFCFYRGSCVRQPIYCYGHTLHCDVGKGW